LRRAVTVAVEGIVGHVDDAGVRERRGRLSHSIEGRRVRGHVDIVAGREAVHLLPAGIHAARIVGDKLDGLVLVAVIKFAADVFAKRILQ